MKNVFRVFICWLLVFLGHQVFAETDDPYLSKLESQLLEQKKELERLQEQISAREPQQQNTSQQENPRLFYKADFRYPHDTISDDAKDTDRIRHRIRAHAQVGASVNDSADIIFGIATGDDDPVSTNQTLGDGASSKEWRLDLAYFNWKLAEDIRWVGGKYKNTLHRPGGYSLLWDGDLRPEGMSLKKNNERWYAELGYNFVESDNHAGDQDTAAYYTSQIGFNLPFEQSTFHMGAGYYYFNTKGRGQFDSETYFGNSLTAEGYLKYNYEELEVSAEWHTALANKPFIVFVDGVHNLSADEEDLGYAVGIRWGASKKPGDYKLSYCYQELQADAVFGPFTDSDFAGGGTDNSGHLLRGKVVIRPGLSFALSYYDTKYDKFKNGVGTDLQRVFLDLLFQYK